MSDKPTTLKKSALDDKIDLQRLFGQLIGRWHYLAIFLVLGILAGFLYTRYNRAVFMTNASILVEDEGGSASDFLDYEMFETGFMRYDKILTEGEIVRSRSNVRAALDQLPLDITFHKIGTFNSFEIYKRSPFDVEVLSDTFPATRAFELQVGEGLNYELITNLDGQEYQTNGVFNAPVELAGTQLLISETENRRALPMEQGQRYRFRFNNKSDLVARFRANLTVSQAGPKVSILNVAYRDHNGLLVRDFLDALCTVYISQDIESKTRAASNVLDFIDDQLDELSIRVDEMQMNMSRFKKENEIVDMETLGRVEVDKLINLEAQKRLQELDLLSLTALDRQLREQDPEEKLSLNLEGVSDPGLVKLVGMLNELYLQRSTIDLNYTGKSKRIQELDRQIREVEGNIRENVARAKEKTQAKIDFFTQKMNEVQVSFSEIPEAERTYLRMLRDYEVNEQVVTFLMERRVAASISKASVVPSARIIDEPVVPQKAVSVSKEIVWALIAALGLLIGLLVALVLSYLDNKIYDRETLESLTELPVLGVVPKTRKDKDFQLLTVTHNARSVFNESINTLRTNLQFIPVSTSSRVICTTSSVSQEGKSFVTINLAGSLSLLGKTVVIVDVDLRKPKINKYFEVDNTKGVSTHLSGTHTLDEVIRKSQFANFDFITSGVIPPNPSELIQSDGFKEMVNQLRERYDYVMIDTPPVGIVSDAVYVIKQSDIKLYMTRAGYSRTDFLRIPRNVVREHDVKNLYLILNGFDRTAGYYSGTYTGYYGSGYYSDEPVRKKRWYKFWA